MTTVQELHETAARLIGPCEITEMLGLAVARISGHRGREFIVKRHASQEKHAREVHAYRNWTASLGPAAPALVAADAPTRTIVIAAVPGQQCLAPSTAQVHQRAGEILRRFHEAEPPRRLFGYRDWLRTRSAHWFDQAAPFIAEPDRTAAAAHLDALLETAARAGVPCHLDFQERNWLLDQSGNMYLIDFEHARTDLWLRDLVRLRFRVWPGRPDLQAAFFTGYGHDLSDDDAETLRRLGALDALTAIARGHQIGDAVLIEHGHATLKQLR